MCRDYLFVAMTSPHRKTSAMSGSHRPIGSKWESVLIEWGTKDRDDLYGTTPFPFVTLEGDNRIKQKTFFDARDIKELGAGGMFTPAHDILNRKRQLSMETIVVSMAPKIEPSAIDNTRVDKGDTYRQIESGLRQLSTPTQAKVCTRIRQWIRVEVMTAAPPPANSHGAAPGIKIWAFLQPAKINENTRCYAADSKHCPDDFPRSGWAEYWIPTGGTSCRRKDWEDGVGTEREIPASQWKVEQLGPTRFVYKICVEIRNERTAGDVSRQKRRGGTIKPEADFEAGCWLKVWVRDAGVDWDMEPSDDEANQLPQHMDSRDPSYGLSIEGGKFWQRGAHAFLRERLFTGPEDPSQFEKASPLYAVVFHERAMELLEELEAMLKPKDTNAGMQVTAPVLTTLVAALIAMGLRLGLSAWKKKNLSRPASLPFDVKWPEDYNKDKAEVLIKLLETLDLANILAAYACGGLEGVSPLQAVAKAGANHKAMLQIWSKLYSAMWDFSLVDGPAHYAEFCMKREKARAELLETRIRFSRDELAANKERAGREKELAAARNKALEAARKQNGLGLERAARSTSRFKSSLDGGNIAITVPGVGWKISQRFPKPAGAPLPMPGIPLVWSIDLGASAEFGLVITLEPGDESKDWMVSFRLVGQGKLIGSLGLHALWSGLWDGNAAAKNAGSKKTGAPPSQDDLRSEREEALAETRRLQEQAPTDAPTDFQLFRILKQLNDYVAFEMEVAAELNLQSSIGMSYRWNPSTGASDWSFLAGESESHGEAMQLENFMAKLGASIAARAHISVVKADYPIVEMPGLASADALTLKMSLDGKVLGKAYDVKDLEFKWGKGQLEDKIWRKGVNESLIWGQQATFTLGYERLYKPEVSWSLHQTASETEASIGVLPKGAISYRQQGADGAMEALLHLTCRKTPRDAIQTAAGAWAFRESIAKSDVKLVESAMGALRGATNRLFGRDEDEDDDASLGPLTAAGQFLTKLLDSKTPTQLHLHASYLASTFRKSDPLTLLPPRLQTCKLEAKPGVLQIRVQLENFLDNVLWVQIREYSKGQPSRILNQGDEPWKPVLIEALSKYGDTGRGGLLQIPLNRLQFPPKSEDVWEVYPWISLVPHACGTLNHHLGPRHEMDMERLIRVRSK